MKKSYCRIGFGKSVYGGGYYFAVMGDIPAYEEFLSISILSGHTLVSVHGGTRSWYVSFGIRLHKFEYESVLAYFPFRVAARHR